MRSNLTPTIIVDSSVWIDYFNGIVTVHTDLLDILLSQSKVAITDVILMEVLQGFKENKHYSQAFAALNTLTCYDILGKDNAIRYVSHYRQLRKKGITIRKSNDVMIAGFCINSQIPLLFSDKDFAPFVKHLGLLSALDIKAH